jgi:uncharacterized repeat protein (TIGR03803 family)
MFFPGTMKMPMKTTRAQFGIASSTTSETEALTEPGSGRQPVLALLTRLLWAAALVLPAFGAHAALVLTNLHSFQVFTNGANPEASLVQGSDGSFYGTTYFGGTNGGNGTVFKISTNGALTSLYSFTGGNDGANPRAGLVEGSDGCFYGTTYYGGTNPAPAVVYAPQTTATVAAPMPPPAPQVEVVPVAAGPDYAARSRLRLDWRSLAMKPVVPDCFEQYRPEHAYEEMPILC